MATYRFGKHPAKQDYRTLRFKDYATPNLAPPPASFNVLANLYKKLNVSSPGALFPMDGNDKLGDCTIAGLAHAITVYHGLLAQQEIMAVPAVEQLYFKLTGGGDTGLQELDVLNYWRQNKVSGDEILAYVKVDPKSHTHVQQAMEIFGGVYLGFQVQQNAIQDFDARKPWTPGTLTQDGHCVYAVAYDQNLVTVLTWGNTQQGTWAWWDECVDETYAILPPQAKNPAFCPGFDVAKLLADLKQVSGASAAVAATHP